MRVVVWEGGAERPDSRIGPGRVVGRLEQGCDGTAQSAEQGLREPGHDSPPHRWQECAKRHERRRFDLPRALPIRGEKRFAEEGLLELQCVDLAFDAAVGSGALNEGFERPSQARAPQVDVRPVRHQRNPPPGR